MRVLCPPPYGPAELFKFVPEELVRKNLAAPGKPFLRSPKRGHFWCSRSPFPTRLYHLHPCKRTIGTPHRYVPVGDLDRFTFHLRLAFLPGWLIQGCSAVSNPFTGEKIRRIFSFIRFIHSYGYASTGDRSTLFAIFPLIYVPFMQYAG